MARIYPVKKGVSIDAPELLAKVKEFSGNGELKDGHVFCTLPGVKSMEIYAEGKNLAVNTVNDSSNQDPLKTIRLFNDLIETITGYSSKERKKKFSKL
ncbi:MAG: DUF5611 family protein [Candidatus Thermoplasmatota archaeon]|jgi:hypothetical protein|nr:DUF5611 family protein [Candidatus Thermoplasmatota archaeon]MCL5955521.1 DUF5611 family protein [Candidatus Thermoplasmatota archaeon]